MPNSRTPGQPSQQSPNVQDPGNPSAVNLPNERDDERSVTDEEEEE